MNQKDNNSKNLVQQMEKETIQKGSFLFELFLIYFRPSTYVNSLEEVNFKTLKTQGTKLIICDLDNTLVPHFTKYPTTYAKNVVNEIKKSGLKLILISNNSEKRVSKFANVLGIDYISNAKKPFIKKIKNEIEIRNYNLNEVLIIGDMIIMDILAANFLKVNSILVRPIISYNYKVSKILTWLEKNIFKRFERNNLLIEYNIEKVDLYDREYEIL